MSSGRFRSFERESTFELDLAPMLALMVSIIPLLLLNAGFAKMAEVSAPVPQIVLNPTHAQSRPQENPSATMHLYIEADGFKWVTKAEKGETSIRIPKIEGKLDLKRLRDEAIQVKHTHTKVTAIELNPIGDIPYDQIIATMDQIRNSEKGELLFPDVVLSNVVEGL